MWFFRAGKDHGPFESMETGELVGYQIDYLSDSDADTDHHGKIVVWGDKELRDYILKVLKGYASQS